MSSTIQAVRGMNDILPDEAPLWEFFEDTVRDWVRGFGYRPIRMPLLEKTDLFVRSIGEVTDIVEKEMYTFVDALSGESLTLRPEGTAACVRAALEHNLLYGGPQRLCYAGPMFRHERPQKGRYRQFHQLGVESLGYAGPDMDAEHLVMVARLWKTLGLTEISLQINTLGSAPARARHRARLIDYLSAHLEALDEDARRRLHTNPLRVLDSKNPAMQELIEGAPRLLDELDEVSLKHFEELQAILRQVDIPFEINPRLVRGLDYYNFTVYEWVTTKLGAQGTVCAGGRYDGLVEQLGGKPTPACGFAMGVERLISLLREAGGLPETSVLDGYVVHQGARADAFAWAVAESLRDAGLRVVYHCGGGKFAAQMRRADGSGARYAVIVGDDEAACQEVSLKPLRALEAQARVSVQEAADIMRSGRQISAAQAGAAP